MPKIIAFTGSNSETSINDQLLKYALKFIKKSEVQYIDLKPLSVPIYSEKIEKSSGVPNDIQELVSQIKSSDALIVAVNEHNGTMSAFFKNITDWLSRSDAQYLLDKPIFLLATSPGAGGARFCLDYTTTNFQKFGGKIVDKFSLPLFGENFKNAKLSHDYSTNLESLITNFENEIKQA